MHTGGGQSVGIQKPWRGIACIACLWITLWITCGYVDNFLFMYVFVLCVYGFLWGESDKFYMFVCVVDNFVDNLWITFIK